MQLAMAHDVPAPSGVPPPLVHAAGSSSVQLLPRQHACVAQLVAPHVVPAPCATPPLAAHAAASRSAQVPPGRQQASVGRGQFVVAHVVPAP
jgi:hypothetical protein